MSEEEKKAIEILTTFEFRQKTINYKNISLEDVRSITTILNLIENQQKEIEELRKENKQFRRTGKLAINTRDNKVGVILREFKTGQIQVLEKIQPKVINTHDSWKTLKLDYRQEACDSIKSDS